MSKLALILISVFLSLKVEGDDLKSACQESTQSNYLSIHQPVDEYSGALSWKPYLFSLAPSKQERSQSLSEVMKDPELKYLPDIAKNSVKYLDEESQKRFSKFIQFALPECYQKSEPAKLASIAPYACPFYDNECRSAVKFLIQRLSPCSGGFGFISLPHEIYEMGSNPIFAQATAKLAMRTLDLVKQADAGNPIYADLFRDAKAAFIASGATKTQAKKYAFQLLGVYGTRGADMQPMLDRQFFATKENYIVFAALGVIASSMSYLDAVMFPDGHTYSIPKEIGTHCDYTRPYHFWLPAYLAYILKQAGFSNSATSRAVHILTVGYETMSTIGTKDGKQVFSSKSYLLETQKNIAFGDVGISWGALSADDRHKDLNSDDYLRAIIKSSNGVVLSSGIKIFRPIISKASKVMGVDVESALKWRATVGSEGATSLIRNDLE